MKRLGLVILAVVLWGCQQTTDEIRLVPSHKPIVRNRRVLKARAEFVVDVITIPRSARHKLDTLKSYMETAGVFGGDEKLLRMNGLMVGRSDMRFREQFRKTVESMHSDPKQVVVMRLEAGGRSQVFDVGDVISNETLFVWTDHNTVTGRHYRRARYRMIVGLEGVKEKKVELKTSWQVQTASGLRRTVSISPLDVQAELAAGQSLVIGPVDFRGRGVGRAFLSGVEEKAIELTFFVITAKDIHEKTQSP